LSQRHLQTTTVAEIAGKVVGYIVLETPDAPQADDGRWLWHALQLHNGFFGALRGLLLMVLIDNNHRVGNDEIYIEMLGVAPAWRGRGIARYLINHARVVAQTRHLKRLTLDVATDNIPALELYKKLGFAIKSKQHSRLLRWITGHPGYCEMVKEIAWDE
jgi:ribosomal protein S18 acetylase RimI-like enzyme